MRKIYIKQYLLVCAFLMLSCFAFAQTSTISGKIVDETNQPLPGATVTLKGTQYSAGTDPNGNYRITGVKAGQYSMRVSFTGYTIIEKPVTVNGNTVADFNLVPDSKSLTEVVVIGYGTQRKKDLTGAITNITAKDFNTGVVTTPEQLIQGKVAGVSIISNSGAPGAGSTIRIRGTASISGSKDPLIVIDGVPLSNSAISGAANGLSLINPNDIESFSILKDASASAIYGNRASNGVILITTKKGQSGSPVVNFSTQFSLSKLTKEASVLSPGQFRNFITTHDTSSDGTYSRYLGSANTDWQKEIYQTAVSSDNNISISGTTGKLPYRVSAGYLNQDGILKTGFLHRYSGALNLNPTLFDKHLKINFNANGSQLKQRFANEDAIGSAFGFNPTLPVKSTDPRYARYGGYTQYLDPDTTNANGLQALTRRNPVGMLYQNDDRSTVNRIITSLSLDYKFHFLPDLHANVNLAYDGSRGSGQKIRPDNAATDYYSFKDSLGVYHGGSRSQYKQENTNKLFEGYFSYTKDLKSIQSHIDAIAGYSYQDFKYTNYNYASYYYDGLQVPNSTPDFPKDVQENRLLSYYARLTYSFLDKYILTGTIRDDYSSKFAPKLRSGVFPSGAFAWRINQEDFLKNSNVVSDLKLRIGYGVTGNQDGIGNYDYLADYSLSTKTAQYQFGDNYYQAYRPDAYYENRTWEQTATSNIGFDYGFLNDRITGTLDYYYRKTTHLLAVIGQPALSNFSNQVVGNVGDMQNKGVEFSINSDIIRSKDITWNVGFNITYNKNKIISLPGATAAGLKAGKIAGGTGSMIQINNVGQPVNSFYVLQQVYDAKGKPIENLFVDRNGDGTINDDDLYPYKSPDPTTFLGINSNVTYKKWNAGFVARANFGNYAYNNVASNTGNTSNFLASIAGGAINNGSTDVLNTGFVGRAANDKYSDYYVQNASFFRMDNVHAGYDFGDVIGHAASLRISFNVQNVFIITKYKGIDPELNNGIDNQLYPRPRTYSLGLNLTVK